MIATVTPLNFDAPSKLRPTYINESCGSLRCINRGRYQDRTSDLLGLNCRQQGPMKSHGLATSDGSCPVLVRVPRLLYFAAVRDSSAPKAMSGCPAASATCWALCMTMRISGCSSAVVAARSSCQDHLSDRMLKVDGSPGDGLHTQPLIGILNLKSEKGSCPCTPERVTGL
jgi:hypothetical protein